MEDLLLGIDVGTSSTKGILATPDGTIVAATTRAHNVSVPRPHWAEMDPERIWWSDLVAITRELTTDVTPSRIAGVCVSGLGPCVVVCDDDGRPVRPAILYGIDGRATDEIADLTRRLGRDEILGRCGKALSTQAVGPKLLWLSRHEPEAWARGRRWYGCNSYLVGRLTGEYVQDHHSASQCDPLYDIREHAWADDWSSDIVGHLEMPRLVWPHDLVGTVTRDAADETGLRPGTPVAAGTVDAWAEAYSAGARQPGDLMLMYGTTMFFVQVLEQLRVDPLLWTTAGAEPGRRTLAAGMSTSGSLTTWVRDLTGADFDTLVREASVVPAGSHGLLLMPYFAGERTPVYDPKARGVVAGLTLQHSRGHLFRAVYEGIAYGIRQIVDLLSADESPTRRVVAVGGGTTGGLWTQIVSDVTGRAQDIPAQTVGASYGDALLAAVATGRVPEGTDWTKIARTVEPDPKNASVYEELFAAYSGMYPRTRDLMHTLARLQEQTHLSTIKD
jgi:xylulokinase